MKTLKKLTVFALSAIFCILGVTGCSSNDSKDSSATVSSGKLLEGDLTKKTVMTVNDAEITMDTMMYYIMQQEAEYSYDDTYYTAAYGTSYWDMELDDEKTTVRQKVEEYILEVAQLYEIFYQEAKNRGYELDEANIEEAKMNAESIWGSMSDKQKEVTDLTEESLIEIFKKISLATKYYDEVDAGLVIDEEGAAASVKKEDYKEYQIEMMCLDRSEEDEEGYLADVPEKKMKAALHRMEKYKKKLKKGTSLRDVLPGKETRIYVQDMTFSEGDKQLNTELETAALKLKNDGWTDIIDTEDGYVLIRMVNKDATESYDEAVAAAIEEAQTDAFDQAYEKIKENYQIELKTDIWDQIEIGNLTIDDEDEASVEVTDEASQE